MANRNPDNIQVVNSDQRYKCVLPNGKEFLRVENRRFSDGQVREGVYKQSAIFVLAVKPNGDVCFVEEMRHIVGERVCQPIAGLIEPGESGLDAARREIQEEVKMKANRIVALSQALWVSPGFTNETAQFFLGFDLEDSSLPEDDDEAIKIMTLPFAELLRAVRGESASIEVTAEPMWAAIFAAHDYFVRNGIVIPGVDLPQAATAKKDRGLLRSAFTAVAGAVTEVKAAMQESAVRDVEHRQFVRIPITRAQERSAYREANLDHRIVGQGDQCYVEVPHEEAWAVRHVLSGGSFDHVGAHYSQVDAAARAEFMRRTGFPEVAHRQIADGVRYHLIVKSGMAGHAQVVLSRYQRP